MAYKSSVILTIGTFDLLHDGHRELFRESAKFGRVIAAVNRDEFVHRYKGRYPEQDLTTRLLTVDNEDDVEIALVNVGDENAKVIIEAVYPDLITIGDDWLDEGGDEERYLQQLGVTKGWLDSRSLEVYYVPRTTGLSTTKLREVNGRQ